MHWVYVTGGENVFVVKQLLRLAMYFSTMLEVLWSQVMAVMQNIFFVGDIRSRWGKMVSVAVALGFQL